MRRRQDGVYNTHMKSSELIALLEQSGWTLKRVKGSHHQFSNAAQPGKVLTVPHPKKDLGVGLVHRILKDAKLK